MKRSASELVMEAFLRPDGDDRSPPQTSLEELLFPAALGFAFGDRDGLDGGFLSGFNKTFAQNTSKHSTISVNLEAQSSLCAGTPTSSVKHSTLINQALGGTSGSEQSDAESLEIEIEGGPCEQSTNIIDIKRMRRMISNRESARRSRKRKQAHLADLESQVDQLRGENASLFKQLADANQEFTEAATNNRILKSNVEALRIKNKQEDEIANPSQVKMAEDLVTRNTSACSIDHLQVSNVASPQFLNPQQPSRASPDFLPTIEFQGDDSFTGIPTAAQVKNIGPETEGNRVPSGKLWD